MNLYRIFYKTITVLVLVCIPPISFAEADNRVVIFAAASLTNAINEIASMYEKDKKTNIQTSFASSSTLAKQIENGAPADIFISADTKWVNYLKDKKVLQENTITNLLSNTLVLIAPKGKSFKVNMNESFDINAAFKGKICTGDTASVPVGIYAKQALIFLTWWNNIESRIVGTQDVRAALVLVERAECEVGIVYETDAKVSDKVVIIGVFPKNSHDEIVYPISLTNRANQNALDFFNYLKSEQAKAAFIKYGFGFIKP